MGSAAISNEYEAKAKKPFYLYTAPILVGIFVLSLVYASYSGQQDRQKYISNPKVGDVYFMKQTVNGLDEYLFLRVRQVAGDSVTACYNHLAYLSSVEEFSPEDYFDTTFEAVYKKAELKKLFEKDSIQAIYRHYDKITGFNRMK